MFDRPIFSAPLDPDIAGDDPLGLAPTNERLYGAVFPGVNNVVRYIRVYSALCWIVRQAERYIKDHASALTQREAKQIFNQATEKMQGGFKFQVQQVDDDVRRSRTTLA